MVRLHSVVFYSWNSKFLNFLLNLNLLPKVKFIKLLNRIASTQFLYEYDDILYLIPVWKGIFVSYCIKPSWCWRGLPLIFFIDLYDYCQYKRHSDLRFCILVDCPQTMLYVNTELKWMWSFLAGWKRLDIFFASNYNRTVFILKSN